MRTLLLLPFFLLLGIPCMAQELIGPDRTLPGTLASFEIVPEQEASWHIVTPSQHAETHQVDRGLAKLYFASPEPGRYTVIAGIVVDGKPLLLVHTFINGEEDATPFPIPTPPVLPVSSLETWVKTQTPNLVKSSNFIAEARLVAGCFEQIVRRIETENIKTVQNAGTQLQITVTETLALASPTAVTEWIPFLAELNSQLKNARGDQTADLTELKKTLQNIANALKSLASPEQKTPGTQNRVLRNVIAR